MQALVGREVGRKDCSRQREYPTMNPIHWGKELDEFEEVNEGQCGRTW